MPPFDLSDALLEPLFQDALVVHRRFETVNQNGLSVLSTTRLEARGVVTAAGDNSMTRADAYTKGAKAIEVYTRFRLRGPTQAASTWQPDVIEWRGNQFVVKTVDDYSNFAQGFVKAECISMDLVEAAPQPFVPQPAFPGQLTFSDPDNSGWAGAL